MGVNYSSPVAGERGKKTVAGLRVNFRHELEDVEE